MTTLIIISCCLLYITYSMSPGCGQVHSDLRTSTKTITHLGLTRTYIVHRPPQYDNNLNVPIPLIFGFPGYTTSASYFSTNFGLREYADTLLHSDTFLSVVLEGTKFPSNGNTLSWNDIGCSSSPGPEGCSGTCNVPTCTGSHVYSVPNLCPQDGCNWCNCHADDIAFIDFLAEEIENNYCINTTREYALGYSNGGMMAHRVGCELNDRFAAIAPFAGQQHVGFNCGPKIPNNKIGIINIWGTSDNVVPGDGSTSWDGFFYSPVADVQKVFAQYNGCSTSTDTSYPSNVNCNNCNWQCRTYNSGTNCEHTVQCNYNGNHNYPKKQPNRRTSPNFALPVVWDYFKQFSRVHIPTIPTTASPTASPIPTTANPTIQCKDDTSRCNNANECCSEFCAKNTNGKGPKRCQNAGLRSSQLTAPGHKGIGSDAIGSNDVSVGAVEGEEGTERNDGSDDDESSDSIENGHASLYEIMEDSDNTAINYTITISPQIWIIFGVLMMVVMVNVIFCWCCAKKSNANYYPQDSLSTV